MFRNIKLQNIILTVLKKSFLAILLGAFLYYKVVYTSFFGKSLISLITVLFIIWTISSYSRGNTIDHVYTFFLFIVLTGIYYGSWEAFDNIFGLKLNSPFIIGYYIFISWFSLIIIISRYTTLNIVKSIGLMISLSVFSLFVFTVSIWGTLKVCNFDSSMGGKQDPFYIVISVYLALVILSGLTFYIEKAKKHSMKLIAVGLCIFIAVLLLNYTWKRCEPAMKDIENINEEKAEKNVIKNEPSWVNNSANIATILAWFNLIIEHYSSSAFFAFIGYSILDQCSPKNDPRKISVNLLSLIYLFVGIIYLIKHFLIS